MDSGFGYSVSESSYPGSPSPSPSPSFSSTGFVCMSSATDVLRGSLDRACRLLLSGVLFAPEPCFGIAGFGFCRFADLSAPPAADRIFDIAASSRDFFWVPKVPKPMADMREDSLSRSESLVGSSMLYVSVYFNLVRNDG